MLTDEFKKESRDRMTILENAFESCIDSIADLIQNKVYSELGTRAHEVFNGFPRDYAKVFLEEMLKSWTSMK